MKQSPPLSGSWTSWRKTAELYSLQGSDFIPLLPLRRSSRRLLPNTFRTRGPAHSVSQGPIPLYSCPEFLGQSVEQRSVTTQRLKVCQNCLSPEHFLKSCPSKRSLSWVWETTPLPTPLEQVHLHLLLVPLFLLQLPHRLFSLSGLLMVLVQWDLQEKKLLWRLPWW